jgi:hypothetical protein
MKNSTNFPKKIMKLLFNPSRISREIIEDDIKYVKENENKLVTGKILDCIDENYLKSKLENPFEENSGSLYDRCNYAFDVKKEKPYYFVRSANTFELAIYEKYNDTMILVVVGESFKPEAVVHIPFSINDDLYDNSKLTKTIEKISIVAEKLDL